MSYMRFLPASGEARLVKIEDEDNWFDQAKELIGADQLDHATDLNWDLVFCDDIGKTKRLPKNPWVFMRGCDIGNYAAGDVVMLPGTGADFYDANAAAKPDYIGKTDASVSTSIRKAFEKMLDAFEDDLSE